MTEGNGQPEQIERFLLVRCGTDFFLLDVKRIRRVIDRLSVIVSPFRAKGMLGLARFGGEPLVVVSLAGLASENGGLRHMKPTVVVVESGGSEPQAGLGLAVDEALEILASDNRGFEPDCDRLFSNPISVGERQVRRVNLDAMEHLGDDIDFQNSGQPKE